MNPFSADFLTAFADLVSTSLLHFVWQGVILALLLLVAIKAGNVRAARPRYVLSVATLFLMGLAPVVTAIWHHSVHSLPASIPVAVSATADRAMPDPEAGAAISQQAQTVEQPRPVALSRMGVEVYVLIAWLLGVCALSLRLAIGFGIGLWIRAKAQPLSAEFDQRVRLLGDRLGVDVQRRVFECARVGQAVAVGFLRPVVLIPASWLTQLSPEMIEAIIAHELAHIRRWDLWVNLVQRIIETLLFYHPAVWWLSERIRLEREMCCDEIAAECFDRALYARSLESVARISGHNLLLATSIYGGRKMKLLNRITYLLRIAPADTAGSWRTFGVAAVILPVTAFLVIPFAAVARPPAGASDVADAGKVEAIVTARLASGPVTLFEQYVGQTRAHRHISIRGLTKGYIDEIAVKEGQRVKEGDLLLRVLPVMYQASLDAESAEAKVAQLEYNFTRKQFEDKIVSANELALHEAKLAKANAKVKMAAAELAFTMVKAPFDGIIGRLQMQTGSLVMEGDAVTTLSDNSKIWVYFGVPEMRYLEYMSDKQRQAERQVQLTLANGATFDQPGQIGAIESDFNSETGAIQFRADFDNPAGLVRHGQRVTVKLSRQMKDAIVVPQKATFELLGRRYVYTLDKDQIAHLREVNIQHEVDNSFVVKTGLKDGDRIVVEGLRQIVDGEKVTETVGNPNPETPK